ncbi:MAG TPA: 50S ribosomal protein L4 [SAR86 cluster bacterium]|jgi:large subunit ribosomal protein L4|nr:50S ribosomal protein L4 [SAR86 cluster bacterium]HJM59729.1 50S ribosomal protein L4 [SAR86 cluster bacterium]|tara:strand:+ start:17955 stop:18578 length:624 start_codon:yes stop_codon:yes gene_type:complete
MEIEVLNQNGSGDSKVSLPESIFGQQFNEDLVHQLLTTYTSNSHQNTKGQKNRSDARGGGKKPWKQKGTGRARAGTIRSPIWRGGGVTFAYKFSSLKPKKINKKMYRSAMRSIWSKLAEEEKIVAINEINIDEPAKSSQVKKILSDLGLNKALVVLSKNNEGLNKASKNLTECNVQTVSSIDPSALLKAEKVLITSETVNLLTEVLA